MSQSHLPKIGLIPLACKLLVLAIVAFVVVGKVAAQAPDGLAIYQKKCASCHGKAGEGAKPYPHPLVGNRSLAQLTKYIAKEMPEKLHDLQRLWLIEATRYKVLPLDDRILEKMPEVASSEKKGAPR